MKIRTRTFAIFFVLIGSVAISLKISVSEILRVDGPARAVAHSEQAYFRNGDFDSLFDLAWSLYAKGELTRAEGLANKILYEENGDLDTKLEAHCHFLKGVIQYNRNDFPEAIRSIFIARELYKELDESRNIYRVNLLSAQIYVEMHDLSPASAILDESVALARDQNIGLGQYYAIRARIAFARGDWETAYELSERGYEEYALAEDIGGKADALSDMGFFLMLQGELEEGLDLTFQSDALIREMGDDDKYFFNLINFVLYERCTGDSAGHLSKNQAVERPLDEIKAWLDVEDYEKVRWYLDFVLTYDCRGATRATSEVGEMQQTKPD